MNQEQPTPNETWQLEEFVFESQTAVVGGLIGRVRSMWYGMAAKWALRHLMRQQNHINHIVYQSMQSQAAWLTAQDKEVVALRQQLAEVTAQLIQTQKQVAELELRGNEGS